MTFLDSYTTPNGYIVVPFYIEYLENNIPALMKIYNDYPNYEVVKIDHKPNTIINGYIVTLKKIPAYKRLLRSLFNNI